MITLKLEKVFLRNLDSFVKKEGYQNRTEFIRNAIREKIEEIKYKKAMARIVHLKGAAKRKTSEEEYEQMRELGFKKLEAKLNLNLN